MTASNKLNNEAMCSGMGNPPKSSGVHCSLVCTHVVVPKQINMTITTRTLLQAGMANVTVDHSLRLPWAV